jgi:pimeloyl-ACP methyl ester carboxylesterase
MSQILAAPVVAPVVAAESGDDPHVRVFAPTKQPRGLFVVFPGRGDVASHYVRFGERLSFDGYTVVVSEVPVTDVDVAVRVWNAALAGGVDYPVRILLGVDIAAGFAATTVASGAVAPTALVLAGAATGATPADAAAVDSTVDTVVDATAEIQLRTSCPVHRQVLATSSASGFFDAAAVTSWPARETPIAIPALVLHGAEDRLAPVDDVIEQTAAWGNRTVVTVVAGVHDVLNDIHHRTIAAELVSFAERLRIDPTAPEVLTRVTQVTK